jgi:hypothetical protein
MALSGISRLVPKIGLNRILLLVSTAACGFQLKMPSPTRIRMITTNGNRVGDSANNPGDKARAAPQLIRAAQGRL